MGNDEYIDFSSGMDQIDDIMKELLKLESEAKTRNKRISEIKDWCRARGSFSTEHYVCTVKEQERTSLVGLDQVKLAIGSEILEKNGLINTITFQIVHVSAKLEL